MADVVCKSFQSENSKWKQLGKRILFEKYVDENIWTVKDYPKNLLQLGNNLHKNLGFKIEKWDLFTVCSPQYVIRPPVTEHGHYIVNHLKKLWHMRLVRANNMRPLIWGGGGGHKRKRLKNEWRTWTSFPRYGCPRLRTEKSLL